MTMLEPSQPTFFDGMELSLMSSRAASRARTLALLESSAAWVKEPAAASGPRSSDLLASYDRNTSSWRTSQHCLLAQANGEADGLAEFSETWPSWGYMRNGESFRLPLLERHMTGPASGSWPTPAARDGKDISKSRAAYASQRARHQPSFITEMYLREVYVAEPLMGEWLMGFPPNWTEV